MNKSKQFTKENVVNTIKGLAIASTGAFALGFLDWFGQIELGDPTLSMVVSAVVPTLINMIKEFLRTDK